MAKIHHVIQSAKRLLSEVNKIQLINKEPYKDLKKAFVQLNNTLKEFECEHTYIKHKDFHYRICVECEHVETILISDWLEGNLTYISPRIYNALTHQECYRFLNDVLDKDFYIQNLGAKSKFELIERIKITNPELF